MAPTKKPNCIWQEVYLRTLSNSSSGSSSSSSSSSSRSISSSSSSSSSSVEVVVMSYQLVLLRTFLQLLFKLHIWLAGWLAGWLDGWLPGCLPGFADGIVQQVMLNCEFYDYVIMSRYLAAFIFANFHRKSETIKSNHFVAVCSPSFPTLSLKWSENAPQVCLKEF
ncbi:hypothetical protein GQX74_006375 [Glossina fuscipes]|nr:hypothetical protein GQX74_006375 [Glossina fuscipes]